MRAGLGATVVSAALLTLAAHGALAATCESLEGQGFGPAMITKAAPIAPPFSITGMDPPEPVAVAKPFCRVAGTIRPAADSDIRFEVWLPPEADWNGKYEGIGNGGFAGSLIYPSMRSALEQGYATSGTDTGHAGSAIDSRWAVDHPAKVSDFGWRGVHETALAAKAILRAYYGRAAAHAYFAGCSDGGREALIEAERFPEDYDGIVAGAPANAWVRLLAAAVWSQQALAEPGGALPPAKLPAITRAVLAACPGADGYVDDPASCRFDPSALLCQEGDADTCLTAPQLAALRKLYAGPYNAAGELVFPGFQPGSEAGPTGWSLWITGPGPAPTVGPLLAAFGGGFFRDLVFGKPEFDLRTLNFDQDLAVADWRTGRDLNATDTNLGRFKALGGKLIQYHGWNDSAIAPRSSIDWYQAVAQRQGGLTGVQSFYRLFMAPGMQHCGLGDGPNAVGGVFGLPAPAHDAEHDVVAALAHWVEDGAAPARIVATRYTENDPAKGVAAQRPWCPWPQIARYAGQGSRAEAASYACAAPPSP